MTRARPPVRPVRRARRRSDMRQRVVMIGAITALAALMLGIASAGFVGDSGVETTSSTSTTATTQPLNAAGHELLALLEKGRSATFHARYSASSTKEPDAVIEIETWRKAGRVRQDTKVSAKGTTAHTASYVLDGQGIRCARLDEAQWSCEQSTPDQVTDDVLFADVRERLGKGPVTVRDEVVDGQRARCFTLTVEAEKLTSELCATAEGVPLRVKSQSASMRLAGFDQAVNDEVFVPPASPAPAS